MVQNNDNPELLFDSKRLYFRRVEKDDLELLKRLFCDAEMMHYLGGPWTLDLVTETLLEWHAAWGVEHFTYGVLIRKDTSEPVGIAGFTKDTIPAEPGLEFSWFILPGQQQKGFATEITQEILAYAFEELKVDRVLAETHPENRASARVLEKSQFVNIGDRTHRYDYLPGFEKQVLWEYKREHWKGKNFV